MKQLARIERVVRAWLSVSFVLVTSSGCLSGCPARADCEVSCRERGECTKTRYGAHETQRCYAGSHADCARSEACKLQGNCFAAEDGTCSVEAELSARSCAESRECRVRGACTFKRGSCEPASDEDCRASYECLAKGVCDYRLGVCSPRKTEDCAASTGCTMEGLCELVPGRFFYAAYCGVRPGPAACKASKACATYGRCEARSQTSSWITYCAKPDETPGVPCAGSADPVCYPDGLCLRDDANVCVRDDAAPPQDAPRKDAEPTAARPSRHLGSDSRNPGSPDDLWPDQPDAEWPRQCLIANIAIHPFKPWLAAACGDPDRNEGAVLVFDVEAARLRAATHFEENLGWSEDRDVMRWHPDGERLGTNVSTNGIMVLRRGTIVGEAFPDETRDSGTGYAWVGDQIFADTGALFEIHQGDRLFPPKIPEKGPQPLLDVEWNAAIGAVVGRTVRGQQQGIAAYDPVKNKVLYHLPSVVASNHEAASTDGRWFATQQTGAAYGRPPGSDTIRVYDRDNGRLHTTLPPSLPRTRSLSFSRNGALAVECDDEKGGNHPARRWHVDLIRNGVIAQTIDLGRRQIVTTGSIAETDHVAWSPDGSHLALLLDHEEVRIFEASTGKVLAAFPAPSPKIPTGLPDHYRGADRKNVGSLVWVSPQRLVRIAPHFVSFWSLDGHNLGEIVVRD